MKYKYALLISLLLMAFTSGADTTKYSIEHVKDNVYRFTAGHYHSAFMITDAGIFIADPINTEAASWLKTELKKRFDVPVRYMAYSHNHIDHTAGGKIFADDKVTVLAHDLAAKDLHITRAPTAMPDLTFTDELTVHLGGSSVELRYYGNNNGRGNVSMRFMPANVLFVVDWIVIGRMPYKNLLGYDIQGMIDSTRAVLADRPFDIFVGGHADMGNTKDIEIYLRYLESLYVSVLDGMLEGKELKTLQTEIKLPEYSDFRMYEEWLPLNVEGVYNSLIETSYFNFRPDVGP